jgi:hypothetical protein
LFNPSSGVNDRLRSEQRLPSVERVDVLADRIAMYVDSLVPQGHVRCLAVGGDTMLAEAVERRKSRTDWQCIDLQRLPYELGDAPWRKFGPRDGGTIPHRDGELDVALLCDVLHEAPAAAPHLLAEAARVARHVLVKDRFAHGPHARASFVRLVSEQGLRITALDCELGLHAHSRGARLRRKTGGQFLAALTR